MIDEAGTDEVSTCVAVEGVGRLMGSGEGEKGRRDGVWVMC